MSELLVNQHLGPFAIPIVLADESPGRHAAGTFDAVQIIEQPQRRIGWIAIDGKIAIQPAQRFVDRSVGLLRAAAGNRVAPNRGVAGAQFSGGDDHRCDPRAGHAAGAGKARFVAPRAVGILGFLPMIQRQPPGFVVHRHAGPLGLVQTQQGELRVRVVADVRSARLGVRPHSGPRPVFDLLLFQPFGIAPDQDQVPLRLGGAKHHRLQRAGVGGGRLNAAQVSEALCAPPRRPARNRS